MFGIMILICTSCAIISNHYITKDSLIKQAEKKGDKIILDHENIVGWNFRNIRNIVCNNKENKLVSIGIDQNSQLKILKKDGRYVKMYFTTAYTYNDTIYGLRSRILSTPRKVALNEIMSIELYSEFKREKIVKD